MHSSDDVSDYVRARIEDWLQASNDRTAREFAELAQLTPTHISTIRGGTRGVGRDALLKIAGALNMSVDEVVRAAEHWRRTGDLQPPPAREIRIEYFERYPNRALAIEVARRSGLSPQAIADIQSMELQSESDPTPLDWLDWMRGRDRELKFRAKAPLSALRDDERARQRLEQMIEEDRPKPLSGK